MKVVNTSLSRTMREVDEMLRKALDRFLGEDAPAQVLVMEPGVEITQSDEDPDVFIMKLNIPINYITVDVIVSREDKEEQDESVQR